MMFPSRLEIKLWPEYSTFWDLIYYVNGLGHGNQNASEIFPVIMFSIPVIVAISSGPSNCKTLFPCGHSCILAMVNSFAPFGI